MLTEVKRVNKYRQEVTRSRQVQFQFIQVTANLNLNLQRLSADGVTDRRQKQKAARAEFNLKIANLD